MHPKRVYHCKTSWRQLNGKTYPSNSCLAELLQSTPKIAIEMKGNMGAVAYHGATIGGQT
jgi:hypothetical protein